MAIMASLPTRALFVVTTLVACGEVVIVPGEDPGDTTGGEGGGTTSGGGGEGATATSAGGGTHEEGAAGGPSAGGASEGGAGGTGGSPFCNCETTQECSFYEDDCYDDPRCIDCVCVEELSEPGTLCGPGNLVCNGKGQCIPPCASSQECGGLACIDGVGQ